MSRPRLIAFSGKAGAGKDTAAQALYPLGFERLPMAGALKNMIRDLLRFQGVPDKVIEEMVEGSLKEATTTFLGGKSPRVAMQTLGTEWGRDCMSPTLWVDAIRRKIEANPEKSYVITDIRFLNEAIMVRELEGLLVRIERPDAAGTTHTGHASETESAQFRCDKTINNTGDIDALHARVRELAGYVELVGS